MSDRKEQQPEYIELGNIKLRVGWSPEHGRLLIGVMAPGEELPSVVYPIQPDVARAFAQGILDELLRRAQ